MWYLSSTQYVVCCECYAFIIYFNIIVIFMFLACCATRLEWWFLWENHSSYLTLLCVFSPVHSIWLAWKGNRGSYCGWCCLIQKVSIVNNSSKYKHVYSTVCVTTDFCVFVHSQTDRLFALSRLKQSGAYLTTTEAVLLQLVQDAKHPSFKEVMFCCADILLFVPCVINTSLTL